MTNEKELISFQNRRLIIAIQHGKESLIASLVEKYLGSISFVDKNFDTDLLGLFTG